MKRVAAVVGFAAVIVLVAWSAKQGPTGERKKASAPPRDAAVDARVYSEADLASATYKDLDEIVDAGRAAKGKLAIVTVSRGELREEDFTAYACGQHLRSAQMYLTIPEHLRDHVRAVPKNARGACPRVLMRVHSVGPFSSGGHRAPDGSWATDESALKIVIGDTLAIFDVTPLAKTTPRDGVQFATYDDIVLSKFKGGEAAELVMKATTPSEYSTHVIMRTCEDDSDDVHFPAAKLDSALQRITECRRVLFQLRERKGPDLAGQRIEGDLIQVSQ
jgi:hypothetical protein